MTLGPHRERGLRGSTEAATRQAFRPDSEGSQQPEGSQEPGEDQGGGPAVVGHILAGGLRVFESLGETTVGPLYRAEYPAIYGEPPVEVALVVLQRGPSGRELHGHSAEPACWREQFPRAWIDHPNVAAIYGTGDTPEGLPYAATELLRGEPLSEVLGQQGRLPLDKALDLFGQVAAGLEAIHAAGIVHGNLSPDGIVVTRATDGHPHIKLSPFELIAPVGQPRVESSADQGARPAYASPERLAGCAPSERSDVFSLGVLLHQLLTGVTPGFGSPEAGTIPDGARAVLFRALAPAASERFQTVGEFVGALKRETKGLRRRARTVARRTLALGAVLVRALKRATSSLRARGRAVARRSFALGAVLVRALKRATPTLRRRARRVVRRTLAVGAVGVALTLTLAGLWLLFRSSQRYLRTAAWRGPATVPGALTPSKPPDGTQRHPASRDAARVVPAEQAPKAASRQLQIRPAPQARPAPRESPPPLRHEQALAPAAALETARSEPAELHIAAPDQPASDLFENGRVEQLLPESTPDSSASIPPKLDYRGAVTRASALDEPAREASPPTEVADGLHPPTSEPAQAVPMPSRDSGRSNSEVLHEPAFRVAFEDAKRLGIAIDFHELRVGFLRLTVGPGMGTVSSADYNLARLFNAYAEASSIWSSQITIELWKDGAKIGEVTPGGVLLSREFPAPR